MKLIVYSYTKFTKIEQHQVNNKKNFRRAFINASNIKLSYYFSHHMSIQPRIQKATHFIT